MKTFLDSDFLLHSDTARALYHEHAAQQPIIDYHCHLNPKEIADKLDLVVIATEIGRAHV